MSTKVLYAQHYDSWRSQFVKWNLGMSYSGGSLADKNEGKNKWVNKYTANISVDVALSKIFYFDSGELYLQPYFEVSLPTENPYDENLKFMTYAGGVNFKKHFNHNFDKGRFYLLFGGKLEYIAMTLDYINNHKQQQYHSKKLDYALNLGAGYTISDRIEIFALYSRGFGKVYAVTDPTNMNNLATFSIGFRAALIKNWWFSK